MLGRIRRKLRQIRYYSAPRQQSRWTRALDWSFLAALVLAIPLTWMSDRMVGRTRPVLSVSGQLVQWPDQSVQAILVSSAPPPPAWIEATPIGIFVMEVNDVHHGWPITTSVEREPARLDLHLRNEARPRPNAQLQARDPIRIGIAEALTRDGHENLLAAWPASDDPASAALQRRSNWFAWVLGAGVWWIMLTFGSAGAIRTARFLAALMQGTKQARQARFRSEGKCHVCGYDLTGLEFNERCPECGELVW